MEEQNQCANGHASMGDGQCNIVGCAHCDPIVTKPTHRKEGLSMGSPKDHGVHRRRIR